MKWFWSFRYLRSLFYVGSSIMSWTSSWFLIF